ncbi:NADH-quinone oxidoreductase subunit NuoF [Cloacibacillus porcorum]|uniref:NADH dehydrogenase n=1 Tax=Cloacibacillus porcorum TaxID=1197717 RepID=A0A1B2I170_9BACT|nr:NADH-quinone oxidoreductase subunit NuoF [Cloacibacillus porcorum]ANZ43687.1 NADH dehydrogenase [Cloacibacillus porcorum]MCC8184808.1 NADH-quinone oxidoreductase subunit NuoF [Cloacibacillus porcorum]MCI5865037.1 NADH-quinone oxidoreductase subunit NuoF [Cloacibacillus porcorum]MDD7650718.1 NADH-quinone oxidoreductase subunit NuoF [Cloacibacillus porcorum]MDY4093142.1 NADH-quinone oxidoreductase subunit NuoF [Cloacibacillus porcorum]
MALVRAHVLVCTGTGCVSSGSKKVIAKLEEELKANSLDKEVKIVETGCQGFCEQGPLVIIYPEGTFYTHVQESDVPEIVSEHLIKGRIVGRLLFKEPLTAQSVPDYADIDFYKKQHRLVLKNCGHINPDSLEEYIGADGYEGLAKVLLTMTPEQVVEEMKKTGLRGRGGGGFPTGMKWGFCQKSPGPKKYIICNADEGDPGAFMDRSLLEGDPHAILEGMIIGAYAIGADEGYIYCRAEYPLAIKRLKQAIAQAEEAGLLGENILGTDFNCTIHIKEGAGAFVCGEETALMASIEGKRGMPRPRPPFPAVKGLWEKPSNINNVETFANVPYIFRVGAEEYAKLGTEKSKGTKVFALTGKINNTGLAEVPMGITMREIIFDIGGGIIGGKKFKAVQIGGPSGGCIPEQLLDTPVDYDSLIAAGAMMGSGGLVVMDEETCMVDVAKFFLNFTQSESCGKCTPCREGTKRMLEMLEKITDGKGEDGDIEKLEKLASSIKAGALCALGQTAPNPILSTLRYFRDEYEAHIKEKRCPAGACHHLLTYKITDACKGCSLCAKNCPVNAISGEPKQKYVIDAAKCIKCGACLTKCPFKAIVRG